MDRRNMAKITLVSQNVFSSFNIEVTKSNSPSSIVRIFRRLLSKFLDGICNITINVGYMDYPNVTDPGSKM